MPRTVRAKETGLEDMDHSNNEINLTHNDGTDQAHLVEMHMQKLHLGDTTEKRFLGKVREFLIATVFGCLTPSVAVLWHIIGPCRSRAEAKLVEEPRDRQHSYGPCSGRVETEVLEAKLFESLLSYKCLRSHAYS